jgi:hypothetical protein
MAVDDLYHGRMKADSDPPLPRSEFTLLLHALETRGYVQVSDPVNPGPLTASQRRLLFPGPIETRPQMAWLTATGKEHLWQLREDRRAATGQTAIPRGLADVNERLRQRNPWKIGDD